MGVSRDYRARSKPVPSTPGLPASRAKQTHQHDATLARFDVTGDGGLEAAIDRMWPLPASGRPCRFSRAAALVVVPIGWTGVVPASSQWVRMPGEFVVLVGQSGKRGPNLMKNERRTSTDLRRHDGFPAQTDPSPPVYWWTFPFSFHSNAHWENIFHVA